MMSNILYLCSYQVLSHFLFLVVKIGQNRHVLGAFFLINFSFVFRFELDTIPIWSVIGSQVIYFVYAC
jgi:hypothetical protein